jgi:hypothetical protein
MALSTGEWDDVGPLGTGHFEQPRLQLLHQRQHLRHAADGRQLVEQAGRCRRGAMEVPAVHRLFGW